VILENEPTNDYQLGATSQGSRFGHGVDRERGAVGGDEAQLAVDGVLSRTTCVLALTSYAQGNQSRLRGKGSPLLGSPCLVTSHAQV
jgi:hypothetical protein